MVEVKAFIGKGNSFQILEHFNSSCLLLQFSDEAGLGKAKKLHY